MAKSDWDYFLNYRLGAFNLIEVRLFLQSLLNAYLKGSPVSSVSLSKSLADSIFRFLQETNLSDVNSNKKSDFHRVGKEAR